MTETVLGVYRCVDFDTVIRRKADPEELKQEIEKQIELLENLQKTNAYLLDLYMTGEPMPKGCKGVLYPNGSVMSMPRCPYHIGTWSLGGPSNIDGDEVQHSDLMLRTWIDNLYLAARNLEAGSIYNLEYWCDALDVKRESFTFAKTFKGVYCKECGELMSINGLSGHVGSLWCTQIAQTRDLREKGWSEVHDGSILAAIRKSGVEMQMRASKMAMWIPPWVEEAIGQFQQNNGYGNLKLAEFLLKMKPNV